MVSATIPVGVRPAGVAVSPDSSKVYVINMFAHTILVIDTTTDTVSATIPVLAPFGVAVNPDGSKVYVTNEFDTVSGRCHQDGILRPALRC
jgi:YVTN family beta-propeller protein